MSALDKQVGGNHYKDMAIQPAEFCERNKIGYTIGTAISYLARAGRKPGNDMRADVEKAVHTLELWLELNPALELGAGSVAASAPKVSISGATPQEWDWATTSTLKVHQDTEQAKPQSASPQRVDLGASFYGQSA